MFLFGILFQLMFFFVCAIVQASPGSACEPTSGLCFWYSSSDRQTYDDAKQSCGVSGGVVAVVDTQEVFDFVVEGLRNDGCVEMRNLNKTLGV